MSKEKDLQDYQIERLARMLSKSGSDGEPCPSEEILAAYSDGNIPHNEIEPLEKHIACCEECSRLLVSLYEIKESHLDSTKELPTKEMIAKAKTLIPAESDSLIQKIAKWFSESMPVPAMAVMATALVVVVIGTIVSRSPSPNFADVSPVKSFNIVSIGSEDYLSKGDHITAFKGEKFEEQFGALKVKEGGTLYVGEKVSVGVRVNKQAYVYLFMSHDHDNIEQLFPNEGLDNKIKKNVNYQLPAFVLRGNPGVNQLFLVVSKERIPDVDSKLSELKMFGIETLSATFPDASVTSTWFKLEN